MRLLVLLGAMALVAACSSSRTAAVDASLDAAADASSADASDGGAVISCTGPLVRPCDGGSCPPSTWDSPLGAWCATLTEAAFRGATPCGGYMLLGADDGADCAHLYLYDVTTRALAAVFDECSLATPHCVGASRDFALPATCFSAPGRDLLSVFGTLPICAGADAGP